MAEEWDVRQLTADGFDRVYVELDWYDGLAAGLVDIIGVPHYFQRHDVDFSVAPENYFVWPADAASVALEREQWAIFVDWHNRFEQGTASGAQHPGIGGVDARYDELTALLSSRRHAPSDAKLLRAEWRLDDGARYRVDGLDVWVRWHEPTAQPGT
ncbi:hypothetical protein AB0D99_18100 [Streptomyces sp. NPDC047971]|uniref:hypothetical protein n=1 Tax=Streptomyces sp. NPDC047971 TaxID=3154499 RepID=UPI0033C9FC5F